jgi:hypothetical protein
MSLRFTRASLQPSRLDALPFTNSRRGGGYCIPCPTLTAAGVGGGVRGQGGGCPPPCLLSIPSEMVAEIAAGLEEPKDIAFRYGIVGQAWEDLKAWVPFQNTVATQKAEYEKSGFTFKVKARVLTEDVFEQAYKFAKSSETSLLQKLEFVKLGAKLADMEPKQNSQVQAGPGFSIVINLAEPQKELQTPIIIDEPNVHPTEERQRLSAE